MGTLASVPPAAERQCRGAGWPARVAWVGRQENGGHCERARGDAPPGAQKAGQDERGPRAPQLTPRRWAPPEAGSYTWGTEVRGKARFRSTFSSGKLEWMRKGRLAWRSPACRHQQRPVPHPASRVPPRGCLEANAGHRGGRGACQGLRGRGRGVPGRGTAGPKPPSPSRPRPHGCAACPASLGRSEPRFRHLRLRADALSPRGICGAGVKAGRAPHKGGNGAGSASGRPGGLGGLGHCFPWAAALLAYPSRHPQPRGWATAWMADRSPKRLSPL